MITLVIIFVLFFTGGIGFYFFLTKIRPIKSFVPWLVFFGGLAVEILVDYIWRIQDSDIRTGGFSETIWFLIQIFLAIIALIYAYKVTEPSNKMPLRLLTVFLQFAIGFILYLFILLFYVVGTGIDSM